MAMKQRPHATDALSCQQDRLSPHGPGLQNPGAKWRRLVTAEIFPTGEARNRQSSTPPRQHGDQVDESHAIVKVTGVVYADANCVIAQKARVWGGSPAIRWKAPRLLLTTALDSPRTVPPDVNMFPDGSANSSGQVRGGRNYNAHMTGSFYASFFFEKSVHMYRGIPISRANHHGRHHPLRGQTIPKRALSACYEWRRLLLAGSLIPFMAAVPQAGRPGDGALHQREWRLT